MEDPIEVLKRANAELQTPFEVFSHDTITTPVNDEPIVLATCTLLHDAAHIAAVRNALPAVIAEVDRLREQVEELKYHLQQSEAAYRDERDAAALAAKGANNGK